MVRAITYLMAAAVGLVIAMALALPSLLTVQAPPEPPPAAAVEPGAPTLAQGVTKAPPLRDNQTLLALDIPAGMLAATLNGQPLGEMQSTMQADVSRFVHPGENTLRLMWLGTTDARITVTYAARAGSPRDVIRAYITPAESLQPGERTVTFFL